MAESGNERNLSLLLDRVKAAAKSFRWVIQSGCTRRQLLLVLRRLPGLPLGRQGQLEEADKKPRAQLTGSGGQGKRLRNYGVATAFGAVTPFTSDELIETAKRLKAFGFETEQITDVTKRYSRDVAGATWRRPQRYRYRVRSDPR